MYNFKNSLQKKLVTFIKNNPALKELLLTAAVERALSMVRSEYTVMPRFGFHQPLDYYLDTPPVKFDAPLKIEGEPLLVPAADDRMGYSPNDAAEYLSWGRSDKDLVKAQINKHLAKDQDLTILDFGCIIWARSAAFL